MQKTRQRIIEYLKQHDTATVDELSTALDNLTAVTVRHHLDVLRSDGLVAPPEVLHRNSPGRPKYLYSLTDKAESLFPNNLGTLTVTLLDEISESFSEPELEHVLEGVADRMVATFEPGPVSEPFEDRLNRVVEHLTEHGYEATWERTPEGFVLHTENCPYSGVVEVHAGLCLLDLGYVSGLLGRPPERLAHILDGNTSCSYLVPMDKVVHSN
jgi:predicted ArsR family transcriptional regulator